MENPVDIKFLKFIMLNVVDDILTQDGYYVFFKKVVASSKELYDNIASILKPTEIKFTLINLGLYLDGRYFVVLKLDK